MDAGLVFDTLRRAGHPVLSVSCRVTDDPRTWSVVMEAGATEAQRAAALAALLAFDPNDTAVRASARDAVFTRDISRDLVKAMLLFYLRDKLGANPTAAQRTAARDAFLQAYRDVT